MRTPQPSLTGRIVVCDNPDPESEVLARFGASISDLVYQRAAASSPEELERGRQIAIRLGWIKPAEQKGR